MRPVVVTASARMAASPEQVWPLLSDTDRANRLIGVAPVTFSPIEAKSEGSTAARFVGETTAAGFRLRYEEAPFEWSYARALGVKRRFLSGPLREYSMRWELSRIRGGEPMEGGTLAVMRLELLPRMFLLWPIAWLNGRRIVRELARIAEGIDAHIRDNAPSPYARPVSAAESDALASAVRALKRGGVEDALADRLGEHVGGAPDADVVRIRPFELADRWNLERRDVLRAFLRAVPAGLVELRWGLICPSCLTASQQVVSLEEISAQGHCQLCDLSFDLELDRAVEATFLPHRAVRPVPEQLFCIGGPARTPHVMVQSVVAAGASSDLDAPPDPARYRVFLRGGATATLEVDESAPEQVEVSADSEHVLPAHAVVKPGGVVRVTNATGEPRHVKIERLAFASTAATAHFVSTIPDFRTLFSSDLLKRSTPLKVARAAVLFSDLTGSTALYSKVGDAAAFRLVDDHFDLIRQVVDAHDGAVVKTMGDAVMATFTDASRCARAAIEVMARFERFRAEHKYGELVGIKLGMHAGACYVVTANGALDYFGQTVNVASRVQHLAESGQLVLLREFYDELPTDERARLAVVEDFEAVVKGVEAPLVLVRTAMVQRLLPQAPPSVRRATSAPP
jgi:class 3 adenylate cyclase